MNGQLCRKLKVVILFRYWVHSLTYRNSRSNVNQRYILCSALPTIDILGCPFIFHERKTPPNQIAPLTQFAQVLPLFFYQL